MSRHSHSALASETKGLIINSTSSFETRLKRRRNNTVSRRPRFQKIAGAKVIAFLLVILLVAVGDSSRGTHHRRLRCRTWRGRQYKRRITNSRAQVRDRIGLRRRDDH